MSQLSSTADAPVKRARGAAEPQENQSHKASASRARQWTIKGLTPETVDVSREAAKRSGMRLNSWIGQALEKAANEDVDATSLPSADVQTSTSESFDKIMEELVHLRAQGRQLESTVNSLSTIVVKLLAERL